MKNKLSIKIKTCLISVYNKESILEFAQLLKAKDIQIISTGGTASSLRKHGVEVTLIEDLTNFPEILDGRVKTLHPHIHGGLLAKRSNKSHMQTLENHEIQAIDMVVINLYPFLEKRKSCSAQEEIIEAIDIGGSTLMRAAAKNYHDVTTVSDPKDYPLILNAIKNNEVSLDLRLSLALKAFDRSAHYENEIKLFFQDLNKNNPENNPVSENFSNQKTLKKPFLFLNLKKYSDLRYGENPHQKAAVYQDVFKESSELICSNQIQGKTLSYNNLIDADSAFQCVEMLENPACVIVKHANPCGVAEAESCIEAFKRAKETDKISFFGSIIAFNRIVDGNLADYLSQGFIELIIAPNFSNNALKILSNKPNIRIIKTPNKIANQTSTLEIRNVSGGYLVQDIDIKQAKEVTFNFVTEIKPSVKELSDLKFAWIVASWVKSNAIVFCRDSCTLGIGAGQMSRFDSVKIAKMKAMQAGQSLENSVVASDAFFPFRDGVDVLSEAGAKGVIQPGGSIKDEEVILAANEHNIAMVFTGIRHFRH